MAQIPMSGLKAQVAVGDGTAGAPSVSFSNDTNTGLYRPGADVLGVVTAGVERMRVGSDGTVGIGRTNPSYALDVRNSIAMRTNASFPDSNMLLLGNGLGIGQSGLCVFPNANSNWTISAGTPGTNYDIYMNPSGGNVGIGTINPKAPLEVAGNIIASGTVSSGTGMMFRNLLINGGFDIWQRGTSATLSSDAYSTADRWRHWTWGIASTTHSQVNIEGTASAPGATFAMRCARSTGTGPMGTAQHLEKSVLNWARGKTVTFSVYLRKGSALTQNITLVNQTYSVEASSGGNIIDANSVVIPNASISSTTFTRFSLSLTIPINTTANSLFVYVQTSGNQTGAANVHFDVALAQLEVGDVATPFEFRPLGVELSMCQRYYQRSYYSVLGTATAAAQYFSTIVYWVPTMRTTPIVSQTASFNGNFSSILGSINNIYGCTLWGTSSGPGTSQQHGFIYGDAEL